MDSCLSQGHLAQKWNANDFVPDLNLGPFISYDGNRYAKHAFC